MGVFFTDNDSKERKKDILGYIALTLAVVGMLLLISARRGETILTMKQYEVEAPFAQPLRIVQLSDLHGSTFGKNNQALVELVEDQQPDLIVMTGDMLDKQDEDAAVVCALIEALRDTAPIYYCHGNHEMTWEAQTGEDLNPQLEKAGAIVLDTNFVDVTVKGQNLRIGGFYGYYRYWGMLTKDKVQWNAEEAFADAFEDTTRFKLLLNHIPTGWLDWGNIHTFPVDLVLTGHYHGGQIRLPVGIYAPYVGLFPQYTVGMFAGDTATCILSTGLGSSPGIPRINNLPQVVVVDLIPEK